MVDEKKRLRPQDRAGGGFNDSFRWFNIVLRTAHIATAGVLFGGVILDVGFVRLAFWHHAVIISGLLLLTVEWAHDSRWPHRGKGLLVYLHASCATVVHLWAGLAEPLLWMAVISGSFGSHMPRRYRHWSVLYGPERKDA